MSAFAQLAIVAAMAVYTLAQVAYLSPVVQDSFVAFVRDWWGVTGPRVPTTGVIKFTHGHWEMLLPTFFVGFTVLPLLASLILIESIRDRASRRVVSRAVMKLGTFLRRQPRVFGFTSAVGYGELLFQAALVGGNLLTFWFGWHYQRQHLPLAGDEYTFDTKLQIAGIVLGYNCVFNMAFLFLPATRNCAWMEFFHISYANGVKYHVALGKVAVLTGIAHAAPFYWLWERQGTLAENSLPCFDCSLDYSTKGYTAWFNTFGELSLFFLLLVGWTSHPKVRRMMFELFYHTHHLYILAVIFAVMHWGAIIWWLLPTLVLYLISRTLSTWNALRPVRVCELAAFPDQQIVKVVLARSVASQSTFQLGQFVYLNVPAISKLQWHPFTISSSPHANPATFTILLKSLGDWTEDLVAHAEACNANRELPTVFLDGFYGTSLACYEDFSTVCLIGGGIGVTPLFAILEDIAAKLSLRQEKKEVLMAQRVHFIFSFREVSLLAEIYPVLGRLKQSDPHQQQFTSSFFLTREPSETELDTRIDYAQAMGSRQHGASTRAAPEPFAEPLQSRTSRILVYVLMLASSTSVVLWLEYGGGKLLRNGTRTEWWPLELFLEITALFVLPLLVVLVLTLERVWKCSDISSTTKLPIARDTTTGNQTHRYCGAQDVPPGPQQCTPGIASDGGDLHTLRDLLRVCSVTVGERPDMEQLLAQLHLDFLTRSKDANAAQGGRTFLENKIGVFFSGPQALKRATQLAVSDLGAHSFDIHAEEFEL